MQTKDLVTSLRASAVNTATQGRIYQDALPRDFKLPAVVVHEYNTDQEYSFDGPVYLDDDYMQIDVYGKTPAERDAILATSRQFMESLVGQTIGAAFVRGSYLQGGQDMPYMTSAAQGSGTGYRSLLRYRIVAGV